ncbi:Ribosomal protein arginine N-methyltransferase rmt3 [Sphaceloma murrayae]|uniref:type I protein arginine methyltransferase n=1 Tax=Sphaceloma murrayae TaxID=2082308 RepID=A0A2K1QJK1_9PEZI|nr:Ribosomal protein arginine N-methyltransferase rmt3 [Sphaceloma murrayae]
MRPSGPSSAYDNASESDDSHSGVDIREDSEGWEDLEPDVETIEVKDFFSNATFPSAKAMLEHCKTAHGFDFVSVRTTFGLDFLECVKLVNYLRKLALDGNGPPEITSKDAFMSDDLLQPTLEDDSLLFSLDEITDPADAPITNGNDTAEESCSDLKQQLKDLEARFAEYRLDVARTLEQRWDDRNDATASASKVKSKDDELDEKYDRGYFETYSYNEIHQTMLQDTVRTDAYRDFIYGNKHLFKDKVVLDVGCGTGILSMFCAKAGAAKVIAVDNSAIVDKTRSILYANGLDRVITCVRGKIEEITLPDGVEKVDIIVSEWMGYCLLFEAMLDSVLFARDRYLKPDGLMVPSHCTLHLGALADPEYVEDNFSFWQDVYGFDMTAMMEKIFDDVLVRSPTSSSIAGLTQDKEPFRILDLHRVTVSDLEFEVPFQLCVGKDIDRIDGYCVWFDTIFLTDRDRALPSHLRHSGEGLTRTSDTGDTFFSTGPFTKTTHWQTGLCMVDQREKGGVALNNGQLVKGTIAFRKNKEEKRALNITMVWKAVDTIEKGHQLWYMR